MHEGLATTSGTYNLNSSIEEDASSFKDMPYNKLDSITRITRPLNHEASMVAKIEKKMGPVLHIQSINMRAVVGFTLKMMMVG